MQKQVAGPGSMAKILADKDIKRLTGTVIQRADDARINPNGIEIRLGKNILFQSTSEEKELGPGLFLKVLPGESVLISSYETFDFRTETVQKLFPGCSLMAFVTPTTTMMREGIMQSSTKIDSGFRGTLNWGLRNSSIKDFILEFGEPIFKLTIFLVDKDETPEIAYGGRDKDRYQGTEGIAPSARKIPAVIPKGKQIASSVEKLDPAKQLKEAGYPFDHISTELTTLHGKFEVVSKDVMLLKETIGTEADKLSQRVEDSQRAALEKVEHLFDKKILGAIGRSVAVGSVMLGAVVFLQEQGLSKKTIGIIAVLAGVAIWFLAQYFTDRDHDRKRHKDTTTKNQRTTGGR